MPPELKVRLRKHFTRRLQHASISAVQSEDIYAGLPMSLQVEVSAHTNRHLVGAASVLRGCSTAFLDRLSSVLREREVEAEAVLYRAGEACLELLFIASGTIELHSSELGGARADADDGAAGALRAPELAATPDTLGEVPFVYRVRYLQTARVSRGSGALLFALSAHSYAELLKTFPGEEDTLMDNAMRHFHGRTPPPPASARRARCAYRRAR